jgi:hypothetical protein
MNGKIDGLPNSLVPIVDVRDVAVSHIKAALLANVPTDKIFICKQLTTMIEIGDLLHKEYAKLGYPVVTKTNNTKANFLPHEPIIAQNIDFKYSLANEKSKKSLKMTYPLTLK